MVRNQSDRFDGTMLLKYPTNFDFLRSDSENDKVNFLFVDHFMRYVIKPREGSYGETLIWT